MKSVCSVLLNRSASEAKRLGWVYSEPKGMLLNSDCAKNRIYEGQKLMDSENIQFPTTTSPQERQPLLRSTHIFLTEGDMKSFDRMAEEGDIIGLMDFMEHYNIDPFYIDNTDSFQEFSQRCWFEFWTQTLGSPKVTIGQAICEAGENDRLKRDILIDMLRNLQHLVTIKDEAKKQEMVSHFLEIEGTTTDIEKDCLEKNENLQGNECVVLVAGESSAGKSSVLNLLFGEKFLPLHTNSCTTTITTIRYGQHRKAKIIYRDKEPYEINKFDDAGRREFCDIVFMSKQRDDHNIKEVQVYLPLSLLKSGLVLVDTPGIEENEQMERYLMEYIEQNQILRFMYIIMSDHVGGVQENRLLFLLKMIIEKQKKNKNGLRFDSEAAFVVCNRFDAIPEKDRIDVRERILEKLGKCSADFDENNIICISTKNALRHTGAHPDYINSDFKVLLNGLKKLFGIALDRRIHASYKWLENILRRIMHSLKIVVRHLGMSERARTLRLKEAQAKLERLRTESGKVIANLHAEIQESIQIGCDEMREHLQQPSVKFRLTALWRLDEIPSLDDSSDITSAEQWDWLKSRIDAAFYVRLCTILEEWDNDDCRIDVIEEKVIQDMKIKLGLSKSEIHEIENEISGSTGQATPEYGESRRVSIVNFGPKNTIEIQQAKFPQKLNAGLFLTVGPSRIYNRLKLEAFKENPQKTAKERAQKVLDKLIKRTATGNILKQLVKQLFQRPVNYLNNLKQMIPNIIQANEERLKVIETTQATERHHLAKYEKMMADIDELQKYLMDYGEGSLFVQDFKSDEIKVVQETPSRSLSITVRNVETIVNSSSNVMDDDSAVNSPRGLWTVLSPGVVVRDSGEMPITIRVYSQSSAVTNTFQEVGKLRCLNPSDVYLAEFLGIHHVGAATPAIIYAGRLQSVSRFISTCLEPHRHYGRILTQTAVAIGYLHSKGLVHMELTQDSLTVDERGEVNATGACLPRRANLPYDTNVSVAGFVYLAPEVLNGELYLATADHYAYGLLILELVLQKLMFKKEKKTLTFKDFQEKINKDGPEAMLLGGQIPLTLTEEALMLVKKCLHKDGRSPDLVADVKDISDFRRKSIGGVPPSKIIGHSRRERQIQLSM